LVREPKVVISGEGRGGGISRGGTGGGVAFFIQTEKLPGKKKILFKETVSRDFRPLVFSSNNTTRSNDSWAKAVSHIDSHSQRYSKIEGRKSRETGHLIETS
jgi:hypothetical protein